VYELMDEELWREHRRGLRGEVGSVRWGADGGSGLGHRVRGWLRRAVAMLGYDGREPSRGLLEAVERLGEVRCRRGRRSRRYCVDSKAALTRFEAAVTNQVALAGGDPAVGAAARALREALGPAARQLVVELVEQAAAEVGAQLPYQRVEVVLRGGEPALEVRAGEEEERRPAGEEYGARITLRLPPSLKTSIEEAARSAGESVNAYVVRDLSRLVSRPGRVGHSMKGTVRT
jgi:HicB family